MFTIRFEVSHNPDMCPAMLRKVCHGDRYTVETVNDAVEVRYFDGEGACKGSELVGRFPSGGAVSSERMMRSTESSDDAPEPLHWDRAFVMNEQGATVDKIYA